MENNVHLWISWTVSIFIVLSSHGIYAQSEDSEKEKLETLESVRVYFKDKKDIQQYLDTPLLMLSQRALDRRTRQHIEIDTTDVPIHRPYVEEVKAISEKYIAHSKWFNTVHVRVTAEQKERIRELPFVTKIVPLKRRELTPDGEDNAETITLMSIPFLQVKPSVQDSTEPDSSVIYFYGYSYDQINLTKGQSLHAKGLDGSGVLIAVMDGGYRYADEAVGLKHVYESGRLIHTYDYVNRKEYVFDDAIHGTNVFSVMANVSPGYLVGTAPAAMYALYKTEDDYSETPAEESYWVEAAEHADSLGVDIINTSLGYKNYDNKSHSYIYSETDGKTAFISKGMTMASKKGMIPVTSAGNDGDRNWKYISFPADAEGTLSVGATNAKGSRASFSSMGPTADGRVKPEVATMGDLAIVSYGKDEFGYASGTSISSPIMAGLVACVWQGKPDKANKEIMEDVIQVSSQYHQPDTLLGYGIPDFSQLFTDTISSQRNVNEQSDL